MLDGDEAKTPQWLRKVREELRGTMKNTQLHVLLENLTGFDPLDVISNIPFHNGRECWKCTSVMIQRGHDERFCSKF